VRAGGRLRAAAAGAVLLTASTGCGHTSPTSAEQTVHRLGAVPIPTPPSAPPTPLADPTHPQLLAMGAPVEVVFPTGRGLVVANGPTEDPTTPPPADDVAPREVLGTISLRLSAEAGTLEVSVTDLSSRDQEGRDVTLSPVEAAATKVVATPGRPADLLVRGTFQEGSAQLTLRQAGRVVAVWDFSVELD
jgi:hypothetical protein